MRSFELTCAHDAILPSCRSQTAVNLRKSANGKAQISSMCEGMTLICALHFADFLSLCFSLRTASCTISFSLSNSFWFDFSRENVNGQCSGFVRNLRLQYFNLTICRPQKLRLMTFFSRKYHRKSTVTLMTSLWHTIYGYQEMTCTNLKRRG